MSPFRKTPPPKRLQQRRKRIFDSVFKGEKPTKDPITLQHRRIFIIPSWSGVHFILLILVLLLIAFIYNNNLTYLLAFLLIGVFLVTILATFRSLSGLVISVGQQPPVFAGDLAALNLLVENPTALERYNLEFSVGQSQFDDIRAFSQQTVTLYVTPQRRGWYQYGTIKITSRFPLGLFYAWSPLRFAQPMLVYPKPARTHLPFPESNRQHSAQGNNQQAGGDDFYGLHTYQAGDPLKHIHWKAYAKGQDLLTKQFQADHAAMCWLDYAATPGHTTEERLSQLCRWVLDAENAGLQYGFSIPGLSLPPAHGTAHQASCLQALALF